MSVPSGQSFLALSVTISGTAAWISPSSSCSRSFSDVTNGIGYTIPLIRIACPSGQQLVNGQCYINCAAGYIRSTTDLFVCQPW